ncbi:MAG: NAD(P)/FAD-dependent oxidoreductase [Candidatus Thorarchaeota archaeon]|nr:MAG: NAD(P)/FAD-dependent oxidoreductase [Candidatus Thorarchaeota archaeon]
MRKVDVVIVGAGSAGSVTARRCAEMGLRTLLMDRKREESIGLKVCGDEISKSHFDDTGIDYPKDDEISTKIAGADVFPPNMKNELRVRGWKEFDGWTVQRQAFGQRLLDEARRSGAKFLSEAHVSEPIFRGDQVVGVAYKDPNSGETKTVNAQLVVDASGFAGVLRNKIDSPLVEKEISKEDIALCYREILRLKIPLAEPNVARVFLQGEYAPNGYAWIFPKGDQEVNAGVGVTGGKGRGSPKSHFLKFKERYALLFGSTLIDGKGGAVPVRRPIWSLVSDGIAFVGDSACMTNPIHGGGLGAGMRAGIILGEVANGAIARRDTSAKGLWSYNTRYLAGFGRRLASLEIFKRLLVDVDDDDMNYGFERRVLEAGDLMAANRGDGFSMGAFEKARRLRRGAGRIGLLRKIQKASSLMKSIDRLYSSYPLRPSGLETWKKSVSEIIEEAVFK